jgi:hypothetical protein
MKRHIALVPEQALVEKQLGALAVPVARYGELRLLGPVVLDHGAARLLMRIGDIAGRPRRGQLRLERIPAVPVRVYDVVPTPI